LKLGLSGIAKRYGYQNVQEFYGIYHKPIVFMQNTGNKQLNGIILTERIIKSRISEVCLKD